MSRPALNILWLLVIPLSAMWSDIVSRYLQSSHNDFASYFFFGAVKLSAMHVHEYSYLVPRTYIPRAMHVHAELNLVMNLPAVLTKYHARFPT
jgi:hypothetical protein